MVTVQQAGDKGGGNAHEHHRQRQAEHQCLKVVLRRPCNRQHIVERHRHVGDDDLGNGLPQRFARGLAGNGTVGVVIGIRQRLGRLFLLSVRNGEFAIHLPAHPKQQKAASYQQAATKRK